MDYEELPIQVIIISIYDQNFYFAIRPLKCKSLKQFMATTTHNNRQRIAVGKLLEMTFAVTNF